MIVAPITWSRPRSPGADSGPFHAVTSLAGGYTHLACGDRWTSVSVSLEHDSAPAAIARCRRCAQLDVQRSLFASIDAAASRYSVARNIDMQLRDEQRTATIEAGLRELMTSECYVPRTISVDLDAIDEVG